MANPEVAAALERAARVLQRRPSAAQQEDSPATARWDGGTRVVATHASGFTVTTDVPRELGGSGAGVPPGWLYRGGIATCASTSIAMAAAREGVELTALEVTVASRSDTRGMLGLTEADGTTIYPGPRDLRLSVRIRASNREPVELSGFVERALQLSPIPSALPIATPYALQVDAGADGAGT